MFDSVHIQLNCNFISFTNEPVAEVFIQCFVPCVIFNWKTTVGVSNI